ncbi:hypothetical protein PHISCL_07334, partial [Aspergillus sclerotialis]
MNWKKLLPILPTLIQLATSTPCTTPKAAPQTCNGQAAYCNRAYSNITQTGSHDSPFVGPLPQQNQNLPVEKQLDFGIRFLQAQTHKNPFDDSIIELCHTSCFLEDAGPLEGYLRTVKKWLDGHGNEVVTLLLTNQDSFSPESFGSIFKKTGLDSYAFVPESSPSTLPMDKWPTMGEMIESGKRLVVFLDYGASPSKVPYILDEFAYYFETPYDVTDPSFPDCSINRPPNASPAGRMYIMSHFLDVEIFGIKVPDRERAPRTNAATGPGSIGAQSTVCEGLYGRDPTVVLVDFVDQGDVLAAER